MEKQFDEKQSLALIGEVVQNARDRIMEDGYWYLLWGYLVLAAAVSNYVLMEFVQWDFAWLPWPVLMTIGGIVSAFSGYRQASAAKHKTFFDTVMIYLWSAFLIVLLLVLAFTALGQINPLACYPLILIIYGFGTWVSGGILKFMPLIIGGVICWIIAGIAFYYPFNVQLLLLALSIIIAYIIPGHMLKSKASKNV
ncbi:MAG: hypothetical protein K8R63_02910 [Bacteroidales bacterium]|nr:hypothetical protein [Bacteroidales bacterium]